MYIYIYITSCAYKNSIFLIAISYHNGTRPICSLIPPVSGLVRPSFSGHGACWYLGWTFTPHLLGWTTKDWYGIDMDWWPSPNLGYFFFLRIYIYMYIYILYYIILYYVILYYIILYYIIYIYIKYMYIYIIYTHRIQLLTITNQQKL